MDEGQEKEITEVAKRDPEQVAENIRIFNRINDIVTACAPDSVGKIGTLEFKLPGRYPTTVYMHRETGGYFEFRINNDIYNGEFNPKDRVATPYGIIPQLAIGADGELYSFFDAYWIPAHGHISRLVWTHSESDKMPGKSPQEILKERFHLDEEEIEKIKTLDQIPELRKRPTKPSDADFGSGFFEVGMEDFDYEKINTILTMLENGQPEITDRNFYTEQEAAEAAAADEDKFK